MRNIVKNFGHGISLGVLKKWGGFRKKAATAVDSVSDSFSDSVDNGLDYIDDSLEEMRHDLDDLKKEDRWGMHFSKLMLMIAVSLICALEFIFQIGGINILQARVSQILLATLGSGAALTSIPATRQMMKPGPWFPRVLAGIILATVIAISFYVLFNASAQNNSSRLGRQEVGAIKAKSNKQKLKTMVKQQELLLAKNLPLADKKMLESKIKDALKARVGKRRLGYATSNCNSQRIRPFYRSSCKAVNKDRAVLSDIKTLMSLNTDIPNLEDKIDGSDTATDDDVSGEVLGKISGVSQRVIQLYSNLGIVIGIISIIYLSDIIIYYNYWKKVVAQKLLEKGIRQGERDAKRAQADAHKAANPKPETRYIEKKAAPWSIKEGSDHALVMQFFQTEIFDAEEKLPALNKRYTKWREAQGKAGLVLLEFRKVVKKLVDENQIAGAEMGQNQDNIFVIYGLENSGGVAA